MVLETEPAVTMEPVMALGTVLVVTMGLEMEPGETTVQGMGPVITQGMGPETVPETVLGMELGMVPEVMAHLCEDQREIYRLIGKSDGLTP
jgi:hypothetical protein